MKHFVRLLLVVTAILAISVGACGDYQQPGSDLVSFSQPAKDEKEWTVLLYFSADSGNEGGAISDINALERGVDDTNYNLVVQIDRIPGNDSSNGDWTDCRRFYIEPDPSGDRVIRSTELENLGEVNMGHPQTLADFIVWGIEAYPAKRYAVMVWGGAMPNGIAADFSEDSPDPIRTIFGELTEAYALATAASGRRLDLCVLWGCNYGMFENDYVIREYCDVTARSEIPTNYMLEAATAIPTWLTANPTADAREFGSAWADGYIDTAVLMGAWAAIDLGPGFVDLGLAVDTFARELIKAGGRDQTEIAAAMAETVHCYDAEFDLAHFAKLIANEATLPQALQNAGQAVVDSYGYPPQAGKPLANFRFVDGGITSNETWPSGDTAELRGTKIRQTAYQDGGYLPLIANNAWNWFLDGETSLPLEVLVTYDSNSQGDTLESGTLSTFNISLRNSGGAAAAGLSGTLRTDDALVAITQDESNYADLASEATTTSLSNYSLSVDAGAPIGRRVWLWLDLVADNGAYTNTASFCLEVSGCSDGATRSCYDGPPDTLGQGICTAGTQACSAETWGSCDGQVLPGSENCGDTLDNDCDSLTDADDPECADCISDADCDDTNTCNGAEVCQAGLCLPGTALDCDDSNICTTDSCDPSQGCQNVDNSLGCDDANACTIGDSCASGSCQPGTQADCDDSNICTTDSCDPALGCQNSNNTLACDDGDACTMDDICSQGSCSGVTTDEDGDGYVPEVCGGDDCDDSQAGIHPGAVETCDDDIDQDCNGLDLECDCADSDQDGHLDAACGGDDCNDSDDAIYPGAEDVCDDGIDQDCSGADENCGSVAGGCGCASTKAGSSLALLGLLLGAVLLRRRSELTKYRA
jgi:uncharacterized protein (TIGR03382 family)